MTSHSIAKISERIRARKMSEMENEVAALRTKVEELEAQLAARDAEIAQLKVEPEVKVESEDKVEPTLEEKYEALLEENGSLHQLVADFEAAAFGRKVFEAIHAWAEHDKVEARLKALPTSMTRTRKKGLRYISQAEEALADGERSEPALPPL